MEEAQKWTWVAPPNWPSAPDGWAPGETWQPDPTWGPPPVGWQFWQLRPQVAVQARVVVDTWEEAERLAAWHMKSLGFANAAVTGAGNDGGIDVRSAQAVAQVKYYAQAPVGAPAVQQLRGAAYDRQWAIFYSLSPYTAAARDFADSAGVALFSYDLAGNVAAVNGPAKSLAATAGVDDAARPEIFELHRSVQGSVQSMVDREPVVMRRILEYAARARQEGGHWAVVAQQVIDILSENSKSLQYLLASSNGSVDLTFLEGLEAIIASNRRAASMLSIDVDRISQT